MEETLKLCVKGGQGELVQLPGVKCKFSECVSDFGLQATLTH
jgi:hypothetical protein